LSITITNNFAKENKKLQKIKKKLESQFNNIKLAKKFLKLLKTNINEQKLNLKPLSEKYKKFKSTHGFDPKILIKTKEYINNIIIEQNSTGFIITLSDKKNEDGTSLYQLAYYLEKGTMTMPARPHWKPTFETINNELKEIWNKILQ
jgi:hypothetical protein